MENASKALLMAGGVLISIVIISLFMLMVNSLTSYQQTDIDNQRETQVAEFNQQYEGYNRNGIRGNELYSLINKVIDYNSRKTENMPIRLKFRIGSTIQSNFARSDNQMLFTNSGEYVIYQNSNDTKIIDKIELIKIATFEGTNKKITISENILDNLATGYDKIFVTDFDSMTLEEKAQVIKNFNTAVSVTDFLEVKKNGNLNENVIKNSWKALTNKNINILGTKYSIKDCIDMYYEYVQFKRAEFNCTKVVYDETGIGQIIEMDFECTGVFN